MLERVLQEETIQIVEEVKDWKEAVEVSVQPLVDTGGVKEAYTTAVIESLQEKGPYVVITPHLALLHARPDEKVLRDCLSFTLLEEPVKFGHDKFDPVDLLFSFAAENNEDHMQAIQELATLLQRSGFTEQLRQCSTKTELVNLFTEEMKK